MTLSYRRVLATLSPAVVLSTAVLACSTSGGESLNESLTSESLMNQTIEYLHQSVAVLPGSARLDRVHPELQAVLTFSGRTPATTAIRSPTGHSTSAQATGWWTAVTAGPG